MQVRLVGLFVVGARFFFPSLILKIRFEQTSWTSTRKTADFDSPAFSNGNAITSAEGATQSIILAFVQATREV